MDVGTRTLTMCDAHMPRSTVLHDDRGCPLCEALELLVKICTPDRRPANMVEDVFGLPRESLTGGCWEGER